MKFLKLTPFLLATTFVTSVQAMMEDSNIPKAPLVRLTASTSAEDPYNLLEKVSLLTDFYKHENSLGKDYHVTTSSLITSVRLDNTKPDLGKPGDIIYYIWIGQQYVLTPDPGKLIQGEEPGDVNEQRPKKILEIKENWINKYTLELQPTPMDPDGTTLKYVNTIVSSPDTTQGSASITSSISETIGVGANIGFFGGMPMGGVDGNASYSISHSETRDIPDVKIDLLSNGSVVAWNFEVKNDSAIKTIQPYIQTLWMITKEDAQKMNPKGFSIRSMFSADVSVKYRWREAYRECVEPIDPPIEVCTWHTRDKEKTQIWKDGSRQKGDIGMASGPDFFVPSVHDILIPFPPDPFSLTI